MSSIGTIILIILFGLAIVANFACQIYVARLVFKEEGPARVVWGIIRGTPTFIRGWRRADELGIKGIMTFWSFLVGLMLLFVCSVLAFFAANGPPAGR